MLERAEIKSLIGEVKENAHRIESCPRHRFEAQPVKPFQKVRCLACGGGMSLTMLALYVAGYEAAGGSANDIWPDYHDPIRSKGTQS